MTSNLITRPTRLEDRSAPPVAIETSFAPALRLLRLLLSVDLGDLRPGEDVAAGEAQALGHGSAAEMNAAMVAKRTTVIGWGSTHNAAVTRLLARHGGGLAAGIGANRVALASLLAGLLEVHAAHP